MVEPKVISFDGLHRAGKGTQIDLLVNHLIKQDKMVLVHRGDGTRKGIGKGYDQYSQWWIEFNDVFKPHKNTNDYEIWNMASDKLNEEIHEAYNLISKKNIDSYILLDRSIITRYFMRAKQGKDIQDSMKFIHENGKKYDCVIPDISFILDVSKDELLYRNNNVDEEHPEKKAFRRKNILNNYDEFNHCINQLNGELPKIVKLDGEQNKYAVHNQILEYIGELK